MRTDRLRTPLLVLICASALLGGCRKTQPPPEQEAAASSDSTVMEEPAPPPVPKPYGNFTVVESSIAGLQCGMDSMAVLAVLGPPATSIAQEDIQSPGRFMVSWQYPGLTAHFGAFDVLEAVEIIAPGICSTLGIAVGDSVSRVLRSYGKPTAVTEFLLTYQRPADIVSGDAFVVRAQDGIVTGIFIGHLEE